MPSFKYSKSKTSFNCE